MDRTAQRNEPMLSHTEENYLKAIFHLSAESEKGGLVNTNAIAETLSTKAASVSDMLKRLSSKDMILYRKYQGVQLTPAGKKVALRVIRKHRLWEVFLVQQLNFQWDQVHEVAEQLEHIRSPLLIERLDEFLGFPEYDPHGDPIPDKFGAFKAKPQVSLGALEVGQQSTMVAVKETSPTFLRYLDKLQMSLGTDIEVTDKVEFDGSMELLLNGTKPVFISREASENILVTEP